MIIYQNMGVIRSIDPECRDCESYGSLNCIKCSHFVPPPPMKVEERHIYPFEKKD